ALPGGRVQWGERLAEAVTRELREETGLTGRAGTLCGIAERVSADHHYVILDYWVNVPEGQPVAGDDAAAVCWASRDTLQQLPLVPQLVEFLTEHHVMDRLR
ncbi:MAG: NUDIX domain-containing protein, partial [Actinomycetota bacterium]|nr:NUDIX domain-containing protein [Actinomycetota bacterium]